MRAAGRRTERGFTLIELLVSLLVLSMVATMLLGGVAMAVRVRDRDDARRAATDAVVAAQAILCGRIEHPHPVPRLDRAEPTIDLDGSGSVFTFYAPPMDRDGPDALRRYRLMRSATGDLLLFSASALADDVELDGPGVIGWTPTRLMADVADLSIAYFGTDPGRGGERWQSFWRSRADAPRLVRVRVTFHEGDRRRWPDLVVHPLAVRS